MTGLVVRFNLLSLLDINHACILCPITTSKDPGTGDLLIRTAGGHSNDIVILVDELKVVSRKKVGNGRELGAVAGSVVVKLEERDGEQLHVLGDGEDLYIVNGLVLISREVNRKETHSFWAAGSSTASCTPWDVSHGPAGMGT